MKVVFISEFYPSTTDAEVQGGVEMHLFQLSQRLGQRHEVIVLARRHTAHAHPYQVGTVNVIPCGPATEYSQGGKHLDRLRFVIAAVRKIHQVQPERIVAGNFLGYAAALAMTPQQQKNTALIYHDVWIGEWIRHVGFLSGMIGECVERLVRNVTWGAIFPNSRQTEKKLLDHHFRARSIMLVSCGTDIRRIASIPVKQYPRPTIVIVARLVSYKRVDDALQAFSLLRKDLHAQLLIIGTGPEQERLQARASQLQISSDVKFIGHLPRHDDVIAYMKGATIVTLPSSVEGFGIVTIEAAASGVPIVSSDIPPTREVTEGKGGILYPVGDIPALVKGWERLLTNEELRKIAIREGVERAQQFDYDAIAPVFMDALDTLNR